MEKNRSVQPLPDIFVAGTKINQRVSNFQSIKHPMLDTALKVIDSERQETKSIWYSRAHFETILAEMDITEADGVRVYFGAYGESETLAPGQLCLLMVLTRAGTYGGSHVDIVYENELDFEDRSNAGSRSRDMEDEKSRQFNYGSPCPPICVTDDAVYPQE